MSLLYFCDVVVQSEASPLSVPPFPRRPNSLLPNPPSHRMPQRRLRTAGQKSGAKLNVVIWPRLVLGRSLSVTICVSVYACARIFRDSGYVCLQFSFNFFLLLLLYVGVWEKRLVRSV
jgi:hypothetical protein